MFHSVKLKRQGSISKKSPSLLTNSFGDCTAGLYTIGCCLGAAKYLTEAGYAFYPARLNSKHFSNGLSDKLL